MIKIYQIAFSFVPPTCRYQPTCSVYAIEAIRTYGLIGGSMRAIRRILRCHPWGGHGYDPVVRHTQKGDL